VYGTPSKPKNSTATACNQGNLQVRTGRQNVLMKSGGRGAFASVLEGPFQEPSRTAKRGRNRSRLGVLRPHSSLDFFFITKNKSQAGVAIRGSRRRAWGVLACKFVAAEIQLLEAPEQAQPGRDGACGNVNAMKGGKQALQGQNREQSQVPMLLLARFLLRQPANARNLRPWLWHRLRFCRTLSLPLSAYVPSAKRG